MESQKAVVPVLVGMMLLTGVCNTLLTKYQVWLPFYRHTLLDYTDFVARRTCNV